MAKRRRRNAEPKRTEMRQHARANRKPRQKQAQATQHAEQAVEAIANAAAAAPAPANPFEPMERLMQAFMPMAWLRPWVEMHTPKLDVIDRNGSVLVRAEVPGVDKSHLAVEASDLAVTIKGEVQNDATREDSHYRISETSHGTFERTVTLPTDVDSARAKATFKDGVLEVLLPKVDRARPHPLKL
jgi:HSP20 family protein